MHLSCDIIASCQARKSDLLPLCARLARMSDQQFAQVASALAPYQRAALAHLRATRYLN